MHTCLIPQRHIAGPMKAEGPVIIAQPTKKKEIWVSSSQLCTAEMSFSYEVKKIFQFQICMCERKMRVNS